MYLIASVSVARRMHTHNLQNTFTSAQMRKEECSSQLAFDTHFQPTMATNIIREINSVKSLFRARAGLHVEDSDAPLRLNFMNAIIKQISSASTFGTQEAGVVTDALKDSPYGEHTAKIVAAIEARLKVSQSAAHLKTPMGSIPGQLLKNWWAVLTPSDWDFIRNPKNSWHAKMTRLAERGALLGIVHPTEHTIKWALALLLIVCYDELPTYQEIYQKLQDFKLCFTSERKSYPLQHLCVYPDTPQELSEDMFKYAYDAEQPTTVHLPGFNNVGENHIPLRKNSKLLTRGSKNATPKDVDCAVHIKNERKSADAITIVPQASGSARVVVKSEPFESIQDSDEELLVLEYKTKLAKLRKDKKDGVAPLAAPAAMPEASKSIHIDSLCNGTLRLRPRTPVVASEGVKAADSTDAAPEPADDDISALDPYAQAAIAALQTRNTNKKAATAAKTKEAAAAKKLAAAAAKKLATAAAKKEGRVAKPEAPGKRAKPEPKPVKAEPVAKKRPAAALKPSEIEEVTRAKIMRSMPPKLGSDGKNPAPVRYNGGVLYTSFAGRCFRALRVRDDKYSEKRAPWKQAKPSLEAWKQCVKAIDDHRKKGA